MIPTQCVFEARADGLVLQIYDPKTKEWRRPARAYSIIADKTESEPVRAPFGDYELPAEPKLPSITGDKEELIVRPGDPLPDGSATWELVHVLPP
jgi:hypothetical protein